MAPDSRYGTPQGGCLPLAFALSSVGRAADRLTWCNYFESIPDTYGTDSISHPLINVTFVMADID